MLLTVDLFISSFSSVGFFHHVFFFNIYLYLKGRLREKMRDSRRDLPSTRSFPKCQSHSQAKLLQNQKLLLDLPCKILGHLPLLLQSAGSEMDQPGLEPVPMWESSPVGGALTYYTGALAPKSITFQMGILSAGIR